MIWRISSFELPLCKTKESMCIFSSDTIVSTTQVFSGVLSPTRRLLAYSNNVTVGKGGTVMMLPIPTQGEVIFHDTTPYSKFLLTLSNLVLKNATRGMRGSKSIEDEFSVVGAYKMKMVEPNDVVSTLTQLEQPVQKWVYGMVEAYKDYMWLFVIIPEGRELSAQPLLIEYEQTVRPSDLYIPMMDVHGDQTVEKTAKRNHVISFADKTFPVNEDNNFKENIPNFPWTDLTYSGIEIGAIGNKMHQNGDLWGKFTGFTEATGNNYKLEFYTPYPL